MLYHLGLDLLTVNALESDLWSALSTLAYIELSFQHLFFLRPNGCTSPWLLITPSPSQSTTRTHQPPKVKASILRSRTKLQQSRQNVALTQCLDTVPKSLRHTTARSKWDPISQYLDQMPWRSWGARRVVLAAAVSLYFNSLFLFLSLSLSLFFFFFFFLFAHTPRERVSNTHLPYISFVIRQHKKFRHGKKKKLKKWLLARVKQDTIYIYIYIYHVYPVLFTGQMRVCTAVNQAQFRLIYYTYNKQIMFLKSSLGIWCKLVVHNGCC